MPIKQSIGENPLFGSKSRIRVLKTITILIGIVFIAKLAEMQILDESIWRSGSDAQSIKMNRVEPFRGSFYDRFGNMFVHSKPSFSITITPFEFKYESLDLLSSIIEKDTTFILGLLEKYKLHSKFTPIKILKDVEFGILAGIEEYYDHLPGINIVLESKREYKSLANASHILGYTREISEKQLKEKKYYNPGDAIGKSGLEAYYEDFIRGKIGYEFVARNKFGRKVAEFDDGKSDVPAINGFDLHLTLDLKLQKIAEELLDGKRGSLVAIDPRNGEILSIASKPDYDPNGLSGRITPEFYKELRDNKDKPQLHRAISAQYPPGSAWKMMVALAGLQEEEVTQNSTFFCNGGWKFGSRYYRCTHTDGHTNVVNSIKTSCNAYFYQLGHKLGLERLIEYGNMFGFGFKTGLDIPFEKDGNYPDMDKLNKKYNNRIPKGIALNWGIGQGEILVTPLQMAVYTAALANKGTLIQPHIVKSIYNNQSGKLEPNNFATKKIPIDKNYFDIIHKGMRKVVHEAHGTATNVKIDGVEICGKTSTSQVPPKKPHGWFVCFAPKENPTIALAVIVENGGAGAWSAGPIAREYLKNYFFPDSLNKPDSLELVPINQSIAEY